MPDVIPFSELCCMAFTCRSVLLAGFVSSADRNFLQIFLQGARVDACKNYCKDTNKKKQLADGAKKAIT